MDVPAWVWIATVGAISVLFALDLIIVDRKPHEVGMAEAARWVVFYLACAAVFGLGIWLFAGGTFAVEYFAGYLTEYSLSVDNLFVFLILMSAFRVPAIQQHRVLLIGIVLALGMRGLFIAAGAAVISHFSWVFYLFAALLIYLGWRQIRHRKQEAEFGENIVLRTLRKRIPVTDEYDGSRLTVKRDGKRWFTPMIVVMVAIGSVDLVFALDSIPAIFGLTQEAFLVFAVNAFALMGLRQLYFLIGGLLTRLVYLPIGLGVILGFIGVKLVLDALHENSLPFLNDGQPLDAVPTVGIVPSLAVIVCVLLATTVASVYKTREHHRDDQPARSEAISRNDAAPVVDRAGPRG
ncbi:MAG: tellurium resistance protein TerC [Pseudonocardiales bacterium]|nr:TerC family protein [Actinomycetota bacterium]PZS15627.1 MAG: tellurium resistance protein TerC [Pseudonocardiales bacterium]